ncbi:hypothetical protein KYTH27_05520 [Helicobacter pylori]
MLKAFLWANTTQKASKSKNGKIFKKMTKKKKKTIFCYNALNTFQMSNECMKSLIQNSIQSKKEKT